METSIGFNKVEEAPQPVVVAAPPEPKHPLVEFVEGHCFAIIGVLLLFLLITMLRARYLSGQLDAMRESVTRLESILTTALPNSRLEELLEQLAKKV